MIMAADRGSRSAAFFCLLVSKYSNGSVNIVSDTKKHNGGNYNVYA